MTDTPPGTPAPPANPQWRRVNDLFHMALERTESDRDTFLDQVCGSDTTLRDEVQSLIQAHTRADGFLEAAAHSSISGPVAADAAAIPPRVGQYVIERVLGRGGMGVVYLAEDTRLGRRVALKAISPDYTHDPARRDRLRREARAAAALAHPGIATIYALEEFGDDVFIAAEYVAGETLREEINRGPASPGLVLETAVALATALAAAHDRGVVHRDLKPENVIRTPAGSIKVLDFGLAQMPAESRDAVRLTAHGRVIGTPAYMAPEQIRREPCDGRTDLFALGILLHEVMTGVHPFAGEDTASTIARILQTEPAFAVADADDTNRRLLQELMAIVRTCLGKLPEARFSSAHAMLAALEQVRHGGSWVEPARVRASSSAMRWWEFHQGAACVCYAALMLPLWWSRGPIGGRAGLFIFVAGLIATVAACVLRLHLWFAASSLPDEWRAQREHSERWLRVSEIGLVSVMTGAGFWVLERQPAVGAVLVCAAVAVFLSFTFIEPATRRAAFGQ